MVERFLTKKGQIIHAIASDFMQMKRGDKIPSVTEYQETLNVARGTIQNALTYLKKEGGFSLQSRGHLGTYISSIDYNVLQRYALAETVMGTMTLPYSKLYEGLATGIYEAFRANNVRLNIAYIRGAKERINGVLEKVYQFAVLSKFAAKEAIKSGSPIEIVVDFGEHSFLSQHVIVSTSDISSEQLENKRIAIDYESIDQYSLTEALVANQNVQLVQMAGYRILEAIRKGEIDAGVWNVDEINDKNYSDLSYSELPKSLMISDMSTAVIIVHKSDESLISFFKNSLNKEKIRNIQLAVKSGEMMPQY